MNRPSTTTEPAVQVEEPIDASNEEQAALPEADEAPALKPGNAYEGESDMDKADRGEAIRLAYSKAQTELRVTYLTEFNLLVAKHAAEAGYDWHPKPTKAEKARAALAKLLEENPELAEEVNG